MDKDTIIKQLTSQKAKDYTYAIIFFLTFSFFAFFVIRPNLVNVFSLQEELGRLRILDTGYENVIKKIINIQTFLEANRSDLYLLDQAISSTPQINKLIQDIESAATNSGVIITQVNVSKVNLKDTKVSTSKNSLSINLATNANFDSVQQFINNLIMERRLKTLKNVVLEKDEKNSSSSSAGLKIKIDLEGYYL